MGILKDYIITLLLIIACFLFFAYFNSMFSNKKYTNKYHNKNLINMISEYYPNYKVKIIDLDPNSITINIIK